MLDLHGRTLPWGTGTGRSRSPEGIRWTYLWRMKSLLLTTALLGGAASFAQIPIIDITVVALNPDTVEVRLRSDVDFSGILAGLTFTLRWDTAGDTHVGAIDQLSYGLPYCTLLTAGASNSDGEVDEGAYRYFTVNAFGFVSMPPGCRSLARQE